jgi:MoxR-like ATPase
LALFKAAQALAAIQGRNYVLPDDVKGLAPAILEHRLIVSPESSLRGRTAHWVMTDILRETALDIGEQPA